jgi:decaprenyl-phosphate phosphoribosyltransferase
VTHTDNPPRIDGGPPVVTGRPTTRTAAVGIVRTARPHQWVKNVLVLAAPAASGMLFHRHILLGALTAFVAFCLAASAIYLVNDVKDVDADRAHPTKRNRPVAAGLVSPRAALIAAGVLLVAAPAFALLANTNLVIVIVTYEAAQLAYCLWLKHEPVMDIALVASGFLLRAIAGGVAGDIDLSTWFLLAASFGSLFMVSGKRYSEMRAAQKTGAKVRKSLERYTDTYLRFVWTLSATVLIMTYGLWAFEIREQNHSVWAVISMVPFVLAVLRYAVDVDSGSAEAPEDIALNDRVLQVLGLALVVSLAVGIY